MTTPNNTGRGATATVLWAVVALLTVAIAALVVLYVVASDHGHAPDVGPIFAMIPGGIAAGVGLLLHRSAGIVAQQQQQQQSQPQPAPQIPAQVPYTMPPSLPTAYPPGGAQ